MQNNLIIISDALNKYKISLPNGKYLVKGLPSNIKEEIFMSKEDNSKSEISTINISFKSFVVSIGKTTVSFGCSDGRFIAVKKCNFDKVVKAYESFKYLYCGNDE